MVLKTRSKKPLKLFKQDGFTLVEFLITSTITLMLLAFAVVYYNPAKRNKQVRDEKRLSDISKIDRAISEFVLDKKYYPDIEETLRISTALPDGSTSLNNSNKGWIFDNLSPYIPMLPTDPINDETYHYSYLRGSDGYELNAKLESLDDEMANDGGDDNLTYEVGNNLNLISP